MLRENISKNSVGIICDIERNLTSSENCCNRIREAGEQKKRFRFYKTAKVAKRSKILLSCF